VPKSKKDIISSWREANIDELDANLRVWKSIRDDTEATDKDRIEAAKSISRQLGALSPDRTVAPKAGITNDMPEKPRVSSARISEIENLLDSIR